VALLPLGIDWLSIDYEKTLEVGPEISKLISIFCSIKNPKFIFIYDFFTEAEKEMLQREITTQVIRSIFPSIPIKVIYYCRIDYTGDILVSMVKRRVTNE